MNNLQNRKLYRLSDNRMLGGVCSGIAQYLGMPAALVRILAVIALFSSFGLTLIVYVAMCFFWKVHHKITNKPQKVGQRSII